MLTVDLDLTAWSDKKGTGPDPAPNRKPREPDWHDWHAGARRKRWEQGWKSFLFIYSSASSAFYPCTNDSASYRIPTLLRLPLYCSEVTVIFL